MLKIYEIFGYISSIMFAMSNFPQIYHTYKSKKADDISYYYQFLYFIACILGLLFSFNTDHLNLKIGGTIESIAILILIILKCKYKSNNKEILPV